MTGASRFVRALVMLGVAAWSAAAPAQTSLRVVAFEGGWNLPIWAAQRQGLFDARGVAVQLSYTPNSGFLITSLQDGKFEIGFAVIDNVIAYQEGQGETKIADNPDFSHSWAVTAASCRWLRHRT